ncbi:hypothetical protein QTJ16_006435 [Diplocarpon rosae]|uniref:DNA damage-binding protein 1 n=1 Tax=Diplocarpon rosae TaxID=946125 RepID=A0AAD9SXG8_9HELO|nr:hypothetical protein QTJ16_006435 [Diplocarpon rosae]
MSYLAPIHRPSSIRYAIKLHLLDDEQECLVVGKGNRIEVWEVSEGGLSMFSSLPINGSISMLTKVKPEVPRSTDQLFVGTSRFQYFTLAYNREIRQFETRQNFVDIAEIHMQDSQSRDLCLVDPTGKYLVLELFEGILNCIRILKPRKGRTEILDKPEQTRITEFKMRAATFLHTETKQPKIAFLYEDGTGGDVRMVTYRLVDDKLQWSRFDPTRHRENEIGDLDPGASHLIPIPKSAGQKRYIVRHSTVAKAHLGGVVVVGETKFTYLDDESKAVIEYPLVEASIFVAWVEFDDLRYLLGDIYGNLHVMTILTNDAEVIGMDLRNLGAISKATVMVNLGEGIFFVGSHEADSQVVRVDLEADEVYITILQTMRNVAPILDFAVMDMGSRDGESQSNEYSTGQARLVTGSGAFQSGSLRSVRSGVGLEDTGILVDGIEDIRGVYALRSSVQSPFDDVLVVSFPTETRIFTFLDEIEELGGFRGMQMDGQTLLAVNLSNGLILQITASLVSILGPGPSYTVAEWMPPPGVSITVASANEGYVLISANGTNLISLDIEQGLKEIAAHPLERGDQVACVHVVSNSPAIGVVGFWKSGSISVLNLNSLEIIYSEDLRRKNNASIPRHIVMTQLLPQNVAGATLFVSMEDGVVLTFNVDRSTYCLSGRKSIVLGSEPAELHILPREGGLNNVLATCEHPSLIYGSEGQVVYSAVTAEDAQCACAFNSEAFPASVVVATNTCLKISQIDTERRTHVRTVHVGKTVRRIAYSPAERAFGIGCIERTLEDGEEKTTSTFALVEDVKFAQVGHEYHFQDKNGTELIECIIRTELPDSHGEPAERFIIGTSFLDDYPDEANDRGRILVFGIDPKKNPYIVSSLTLKCACRRVAMLNGKIVAILTKTIVMYSYVETTEQSGEFSKLATFRCATVPIDISVTGNLIAVADMMQSISIVEYTPGKSGLSDKLEQVARDYQACWGTAVADVGDNEWLESDHHGNLLVLKRNLAGVTLEDKNRLQITSEMNLGEQVNMIRKITVEPTPTATVVPKAFLATTEGSIYLFSSIVPTSQDLLMRLQDRIADIVPTIGDLDFRLYRSFKTSDRATDEPFRFVDGELIERFLDQDEATQEAICQDLGPSVEAVRDIVEDLKRLH